jgi:hypothetical protein
VVPLGSGKFRARQASSCVIGETDAIWHHWRLSPNHMYNLVSVIVRFKLAPDCRYRRDLRSTI